MTVGDLALFAGGSETGGIASDVVDIYDAASDTWSTAKLSLARAALAATVVGDLALFAGGSAPGQGPVRRVDVFDAASGTWSKASLSAPRVLLAATTVGSKAIFAGGSSGGGNFSAVVDIYDASLGRPSDSAAWSTTTLSAPRRAIAATTVGDLALFAGGSANGNVSGHVDVYDDATGVWSTASLSQPRQSVAAATVGRRVFFAGGSSTLGPPTSSSVIDVYDASKGAPGNPAAWSTARLPGPKSGLAAAVRGDTILFAGGDGSTVVDILHTSTGQWETASLSQARYLIAATTVDGRAMFAGGSYGVGIQSDIIDVFDPLFETYCPATINSTGLAATLIAEGSASIAANDLVLRATLLPDQVFLFVHGTDRAHTPFGDGYLCVGGGLVFLPPGLVTGGVAERAVDLPSSAITGAGTRNFQCLFRDPAAGGVNTSNGLSITFVP